MTVAVVTGASGGLGTAIARKLRSNGHAIAAVDLTAPLEDVADRFYPFDLTRFDELEALVQTISDDLGSIAVLVNNAAYWKPTDFFDLDADQIQRTFAINVTATLLMSRAVARRMKDGPGGVIVNVSSIAGRRGSSQVDYGASKAAIINLTMTLARTLAPHEIRVNAVAPALVEAGMGSRLPPAVKEAFLTQTPMKRGATPEEIANVVAFLASSEASYVTGETIDIHGGL